MHHLVLMLTAFNMDLLFMVPPTLVPFTLQADKLLLSFFNHFVVASLQIGQLNHGANLQARPGDPEALAVTMA
jgi:hypothetical protein